MLSNSEGHFSRRLFFYVSADTSYIKKGYGNRFGRHVAYELQIHFLVTNSFILNMLVTYYKPGTLPVGRKLYTGKLRGSPERGKKREDGKGC